MTLIRCDVTHEGNVALAQRRLVASEQRIMGTDSGGIQLDSTE